MGLKNRVKRILGNSGIARLKIARGHYKHIKGRLRDRNGYRIGSASWIVWKRYESPDMHVFFGYYDIQQMSIGQDKLLLTKVPCDANTKRDTAKLVWVNLNNNKEHEIAETSAWCWQQGARLRWHPFKSNVVLFNDKSGDHYVTRMWDILENKEIAQFPLACYDITPDMEYGFSLNYSRLQRLRPGYGYNTLPDVTENVVAPVDDGLFRVNLETGEVSLMISLSELSERSPESIGLWNYINHISVSPDGKRLIFFHIWTPSTTARWMVSLYCINADGTDLKCLEHEFRTSHYDWIDSKHLLTTAGGFANSESRYIIYDVETGKRDILDGEMLKNDGHPTVMRDKAHFITDTYPMENNRQKLYIADFETGKDETILDIYSDSRMFEEKRCDLHPRVTPDEKYISIDTTYRGGKRSVLVLKRKEM